MMIYFGYGEESEDDIDYIVEGDEKTMFKFLFRSDW